MNTNADVSHAKDRASLKFKHFCEVGILILEMKQVYSDTLSTLPMVTQLGSTRA